MTFAIKLPRESIIDVQTLVSWIKAHLTPTAPVAKTNVSEVYLETFYKEFAQAINNAFSLETFRAACAEAGRGSVTDIEHHGWLQEQALELHVTPLEAGVAQLQLVVTGPSVMSAKGFSIGHEPIFTFGFKAYYHPTNDSYVMVFLSDERLKEPGLIPEGAMPMEFMPILDLQYQATKQVNQTYSEVAQNFINGLIEMLDKQGDYNSDQLDEAAKQISSFFEMGYRFAGEFHQPLYASLFGNVLPVSDGRVLFLVLTTSFGRMNRMVLPAIQLD